MIFFDLFLFNLIFNLILIFDKIIQRIFFNKKFE